MGRQYSRVFIMLKQDRAGYGLRGRETSGRCIVETMKTGFGKVSVWVQDLMPEVMYKVYLIKAKDTNSQGICIGNLNIDVRGKGEMKWEFNAEDVGETGMVIDELSVIAVVVPSGKELIVPLAGYRDAVDATRLRWKNNFSVFTDSKQEEVNTPEQPVPEAKPQIEVNTPEYPEPKPQILPDSPPKQEEQVQEETPSIAETPVEDTVAPDTAIISSEETTPNIEISAENTIAPDTVIMPEETPPEPIADPPKEPEPTDFFAQQEIPPKEEHNIHEAFKAMAQKVNRELKELEFFTFTPDEKEPASVETTTAKPPVAAEVYEEKPAKAKPEKEKPEKEKPTKDKDWLQDDNLEYILKNYIEMKPFKQQNRNVSWVKITIRDLILLPIDYWKYTNSAFVATAYRKNKHLIFGYSMENSRVFYFLGIPDVYDSEKKNMAGTLGFAQFKCCEDIKPSDGEYGYWIMHVRK